MSDFRLVTRSDRHRLARDMWDADGQPDKDPSDPTTVDRGTYEDDCHRVLQAMIDAGWKVEVPRGWRVRPREFDG